jgi:hypothetical protein
LVIDFGRPWNAALLFRRRCLLEMKNVGFFRGERAAADEWIVFIRFIRFANDGPLGIRSSPRFIHSSP